MDLFRNGAQGFTFFWRHSLENNIVHILAKKDDALDNVNCLVCQHKVDASAVFCVWHSLDQVLFGQAVHRLGNVAFVE